MDKKKLERNTQHELRKEEGGKKINEKRREGEGGKRKEKREKRRKEKRRSRRKKKRIWGKQK